MQKNSWSFVVAPLTAPITVTCWGHYGQPVVLFASAGGDAQEAERLLLIQTLAPLLDAGRIKLYAVDGTAMRVLLTGSSTAPQRIHAQTAFDGWVASDLGAHIRRDCQSERLELLACGCAFGAASALKALLGSAALYRGAIGLSGTYDLLPWLSPAAAPASFSPLQWLAQLSQGADLDRLRERAVALACAAGDYEDPAATQALASLLHQRGVPCRTDVWSRDFGFGFATWRQMLPRMIEGWL